MLVLVSFFSEEDTPSTDTSRYMPTFPEVYRSVLLGPPCIFVMYSIMQCMRAIFL